MNDLPAAWPDLWQALSAATEIGPSHIARVRGPRLWWNGPLDVEWLALASVQAAGTALSRLCGRSFSLTSDRVAASFDSLRHLRIAGHQPEGFAPLSGFHQVADGWVRLHANYPHHARALYDAVGTTDSDHLRELLRQWNAVAVEERVRAAGGVAAAVRTVDQWQSSEMGKVAASGPWIRFQQIGSPVRRWDPPKDAADKPLHGLRVLDLTRVIAGPSASRLLGVLGSDVLRIDPPDLPELRDHHVDTGFCKRSAELDLASATGAIVLRRLLDDAHVLLAGYRGGSLRRFGLGPDQVLASQPGLRAVYLDAWGGRGPWRQQRGFDSIVQAACGIADVYRDDEARPGSLPVQALDHATGMGIVAAVSALLTSDQADVASLSLARTAHELLARRATPGPPSPLPVPLRHLASSPYGPLQYVPPPLFLDGRSVEYSAGPTRYGSSPARWGR